MTPHPTYVTSWPRELTYDDALFISDMLTAFADELDSWADDNASWDEGDMEDEYRTKAKRCSALAVVFHYAAQPPH